MMETVTLQFLPARHEDFSSMQSWYTMSGDQFKTVVDPVEKLKLQHSNSILSAYRATRGDTVFFVGWGISDGIQCTTIAQAVLTRMADAAKAEGFDCKRLILRLITKKANCYAGVRAFLGAAANGDLLFFACKDSELIDCAKGTHLAADRTVQQFMPDGSMVPHLSKKAARRIETMARQMPIYGIGTEGQ